MSNIYVLDGDAEKFRRVCEVGGTELERGETEDRILCLGRKGLLTLPVTISISL